MVVGAIRAVFHLLLMTGKMGKRSSSKMPDNIGKEGS